MIDDVRRTGPWCRLRLVSVGVLVLAAGQLLLAPAAWAHGDPTLYSVIREVRPALPDGVELGVRRAEKTLMVLANPTPTPVAVLDPAGVPFLRVSASGVDGDLASPFLRGIPVDRTGPPTTAGPPRWTRLSEASTWGWPDPRIDPPILPDPDQPVGGNRVRVDMSSRETQVLSAWEIGMRYGDVAMSASGVVERRPYLGRVRTTVGAAPGGIAASVVEGPSPALRLEVPTGSRVDVLGADGQVFLRMAPEGSTIRADSAEYVLHRQTLRLAEPGSGAWVPIGGPTRVSWVDPRLRHAGGPPSDARTLVDPVELARWNVPVVVDGQPGEVLGAVEWVPAPPAVVAPGASASVSATTVLLCLAAMGLTVAGALAHRVARRRAAAAATATDHGSRATIDVRPAASPEPDHDSRATPDPAPPPDQARHAEDPPVGGGGVPTSGPVGRDAPPVLVTAPATRPEES